MIVASIDIGTNSVLMLIAEISRDNNLKTILNEYRIPRIGKELSPGNSIKPDKIKELLNILNEYKSIIVKNNCEKVLVNATNAFRIAANYKEIVENIREHLGWNVNVVSGEEEALFSYLGATSDINNKNDILVIDIGGGSTELILGNKNTVKYKKSFHTGVVSSTEKFLKNDPPTANELQELDDYLSELFKELVESKYAPSLTIALAGTPTTLSCMSLEIEKYDESLIEGHILKYDEIFRIKEKIKDLSSHEILRNYMAMVKGREDLILAGSIILLKIMELTNSSYVRVSTKGIRYGTIIKEILRIT